MENYKAPLILVDENLIPTGERKPYPKFSNSSLIGNTCLDNCFYLKSKENKHWIEIYDPQQDIRLVTWQDAGEQKYNYLQIYIPPERKSISIEPMTSNINSFNNGEGLLILEPGKNLYSKLWAQYSIICGMYMDFDKNKLQTALQIVYGKEKAVLDSQIERYNLLVSKHKEQFGNKELHLLSAPGRTELGGNHTDHNHGCLYLLQVLTLILLLYAAGMTKTL